MAAMSDETSDGDYSNQNSWYVDKAPQGTADHGRATAELVEQRSILYKVREKLVATDARRDSILKQSKEIQDERMALATEYERALVAVNQACGKQLDAVMLQNEELKRALDAAEAKIESNRAESAAQIAALQAQVKAANEQVLTAESEKEEMRKSLMHATEEKMATNRKAGAEIAYAKALAAEKERMADDLTRSVVKLTGDKFALWNNYSDAADAAEAVRSMLASAEWQDDATVDECTTQTCRKAFSVFVRRHHCRLCGRIFCDVCTALRARVAASEGPQRVCQGCHDLLSSLSPQASPMKGIAGGAAGVGVGGKTGRSGSNGSTGSVTPGKSSALLIKAQTRSAQVPIDGMPTTAEAGSYTADGTGWTNDFSGGRGGGSRGNGTTPAINASGTSAFKSGTRDGTPAVVVPLSLAVNASGPATAKATGDAVSAGKPAPSDAKSGGGKTASKRLIMPASSASAGTNDSFVAAMTGVPGGGSSGPGSGSMPGAGVVLGAGPGGRVAQDPGDIDRAAFDKLVLAAKQSHPDKKLTESVDSIFSAIKQKGIPKEQWAAQLAAKLST